ncbi:MAG: hypothetical protein XD95_0080 [Microgenomates bacterium 39_7]|nr:MAG: hypothetical protein XD95_0080 [Microgenomates bacterium 39_7]
MPEDTTQTSPQNQTSISTPKKKKGLSGLLIVLLILVGGFFAVIVGVVLAVRFGLISPVNWLMKRLPPELTPVVSQLSTLDSPEAKLSMMMESGRPGVCTITDANNPQSKIVYYISNEKMKIESTDVYDGEATTHYILVDGEYTYAWDTTSMEGTKSKMPTKEEREELDYMISQFDASDYEFDDADFEDDDDSYVIDCQYRNVPDSEFVAPTNINFTDFSEMMGESSDFDDFDYGNEEEMMFDEDEMARLEEWAQEMQEEYEDME